ncbi:MAG: L-2-amino-thiazoline-4-carboxylic acid hydrolase [Deltaproteobacteria bacterium]|nr:L-2-amino-thiazoline-4-carboxylic acid hydrolase [Deltaproteobacteria bacterium]
MDLMQRLNRNEVKELFSKNWLTHDAMWYGSCMQELGPEKANRLNKMAVLLMAGIEIKRIVKLMGKPKDHTVETFSELAEIFETAFQLVQTSFLTFDFSFPEKNVLRGRFNECFAHDGVKKYGMIADYECGIFERIKGWLDSLGVKYSMIPDFTGCLMHKNGRCEVDFRFDLN